MKDPHTLLPPARTDSHSQQQCREALSPPHPLQRLFWRFGEMPILTRWARCMVIRYLTRLLSGLSLVSSDAQHVFMSLMQSFCLLEDVPISIYVPFISCFCVCVCVCVCVFLTQSRTSCFCVSDTSSPWVSWFVKIVCHPERYLFMWDSPCCANSFAVN